MKSPSGYLFVKGTEGLGNRLFSLCDATGHALKSNRILYVDWTDGILGPAHPNLFYRYFELRGVPTIASISEIDDLNTLSFYPKEWKNYPSAGIHDHYELCVSPRVNRSVVDRALNRIRTNVSVTYKARQFAHWKPKDNGAIANGKSFMPFGRFLSARRPEDIIIYCDTNPPFKRDIFLDHVVLQDFFIERICAIHDALFDDRKTVGLHIRSTDKKPDRDDKFLKDIIISAAQKNIVFFLATDNASVYEEMQKLNNVIVYPKVIPVPETGGVHHAHRSSEYSYPEQMFEDSLIDLWLLSSCDSLWYQGNSTYSIIARALHGKPEYQWDWNSEPISKMTL